jgi:hypothetical protein
MKKEIIMDSLFTDEDIPLLPTPSAEDADAEGELWAVVNELFGPLEADALWAT